MQPHSVSRLQRLRAKLDQSIQRARSEPFFGLPAWVENADLAALPIVCCGSGHWAGAFLHYATGREILAVVDDTYAGRKALGHDCIDTAGLLALARLRPEIVCINTGQSDAGHSHFQRLAEEHGLRMLTYHQAIRALRVETDIRVADWLPHIVERFDEYIALERRLADPTSVETLYAFLLYHLTTDREHLLHANRPGEATYFRSGLFELSEREVYVDCGTFDGDSVRKFIQVTGGRFESVHAYEPDPSNFARLEQWLHSERDFSYAKHIHLHRQAVGRSAGKIIFNQTSGEGACIPLLGADAKPLVGTAEGVEVEMVSLDDAIDPPISLLKLDVEGHELEILRGATGHLRHNGPRLAICAYHLPGDLIDLPAYITGLDAGYRLGLRHHSNTRYDTVLYAY